MKKAITLVCIFLFLLVSGGGFYLYEFSDTPITTSKSYFELSKGMQPYAISTALENAGIIQSRRLFYWYGKLTGGWSGIKSAEYEIPANSTPSRIFKIFKSGIGIQRALLVKEGDNIFQVAESMQSAGLGTIKENLALLKSAAFIDSLGLSGEGIHTLEGYLFPNTYYYDKREKPENMIRRMVQAFLKSWTPEYEARAKEFMMNRKQIVTLASMIEKETGAGEERAIISSVFHNRLNKKMRLQSDPTTIYGIWESYSGNLHRSDLLKPTEFNTYTIPGLPVGPISNPHPDSVRAALHPLETNYLYFVSRNDGTHVFSHTYSEHSDWVKKLQLNPSAREGKSWRDLNQKKAN